MSSGGTIPPFATQPFNSTASASLNHLFPNAASPFSIPCLTSPNNRIKMKRCRQRVDAGEPRNSYQSNSFKRESPLGNHAPTMLNLENGYDFSKLANLQADDNQQEDSEELDVESALNMSINSADKSEENFDDLLANSNNLNGEQESPTNQSQDGRALSEIGTSTPTSISRRKRPPQRLDDDVTFEIGDVASENGFEPDVETRDNLEEDDEEGQEAANANPGDQNDLNDDDVQEIKEAGDANHGISDGDPNFGFPSHLAATLAASGQQNGNVNKLQEMFEAQRRIYAGWLELQKKQMAQNTNFAISDKGRAFNQMHQTQQQEIQREFAKFTENLKNELSNSLSGSIDKVVSEFLAAEMAANMTRMMAAAAIAAQQQQQLFAEQQHTRAAAAFMMPNPATSLYNQAGSMPPFSTASPLNNLFAAAAAAQNNNSLNASTSGPSGIFPAAQFPANFGGFPAPNSMFSASMANLRNADLLSPPRKKRSKVTDSVRVKLNPARDPTNSLPASARSSPSINSYFPPTMVSHPLYNGSSFGGEDGGESPVNSDDFSDGGPYDGNCNQSVTLTPVHLRKAKLMFFFTRYPSSSLLKSFFPDIRFNKNNTAQLVKWFSNFREFFYMQMEKYAKQAIAEGIRHREEITVTVESEIYKTLNQHYNRNNLFQPPERLVFVIQETLKEFFVALQNGRDAEPSWKKAIYKVISRMDDPIPEYFKDPSFMSSLE